MFKETVHEFDINGTKCSFATGKIARKSQSAVIGKMGDTVVLATVNVGNAQPDAEFFPLTIEYVEMLYAAGKISGSRFIKRDRFPGDDAIIKGRAIDRSIRSRFPSDYRNEVMVVVKVLSFDPQNDPLIVAINAVSAALLISSAPIKEPVAGVRIGEVAGELKELNIHMDRDDIGESTLNLVVAGDGETLCNIDANSNEVSEDRFIEAMEYSLEAMKPWLKAQSEFASKFGSVEKPEYVSFELDKDLVEKMYEKFGEAIAADLRSSNRNRAREERMVEIVESFGTEYSKRQLAEAYDTVAKKVVRKYVFDNDKRFDDRAYDDIRDLDYEVGVLPRVHGSGLFTRGLTQVLTIATLGSLRNQQMIDDMSGEDERRYLHYYVEAPYSFGEVGRMKYIPGRREIGHGALAEKALYPVLPSAEEFPYTIILMSEIMSEEGSSSQGSATASSMALMDAGVPIKRPVAGIAMGAVPHPDDSSQYKIVTDIQAVEDFYGLMDFKVAGTREGITAVQMDTKSAGLPITIFKDAIADAKKARIKILDGMEKVISTPRAEVSQFAPKVEVVKISQRKIGELIGPGGKVVKGIIEATGADINIEDDGTVHIFAQDKESIMKAKEMVSQIVFEPTVGEVYDGVVASVVEYGAFVDIARGVSGLLHVSEISGEFIKDVKSVISEGQKVKVKVLGVEDNGKIKLSMKDVKQPE